MSAGDLVEGSKPGGQRRERCGEGPILWARRGEGDRGPAAASGRGGQRAFGPGEAEGAGSAAERGRGGQPLAGLRSSAKAKVSLTLLYFSRAATGVGPGRQRSHGSRRWAA